MTSLLYASVADVKAFLQISDTTDDAQIADRLAAACRRIDRDTGRRFYIDDAPSSRIYRAHNASLLMVDDIASATIVVEIGSGTSWTTVDSALYETLPENAIALGWPIETLSHLHTGCWPIWRGTRRVRVTATWGWPAVPDEIKSAAILLAARLYRRRDSPEGVKGFADLGVIRLSSYDVDYAAAIAPYVRTVT